MMIDLNDIPVTREEDEEFERMSERQEKLSCGSECRHTPEQHKAFDDGYLNRNKDNTNNFTERHAWESGRSASLLSRAERNDTLAPDAETKELDFAGAADFIARTEAAMGFMQEGEAVAYDAGVNGLEFEEKQPERPAKAPVSTITSEALQWVRMVPVRSKSGHILEIGFDEVTQWAAVRFKAGQLYAYAMVPHETGRLFVKTAPHEDTSTGQFFNQFIKPCLTFKVAETGGAE